MASSSNPTHTDSAPALYGHDGGQHHDHHAAVNHHNRRAALELEKGVMMMKEQANLEIPPGWRFCPTDEELIHFYLIKKLNGITPHTNGRIIGLNIYNYTPMKLAAKLLLPEDPVMLFFTPRKRKYPNGFRPSRTAEKGTGYWKATGADRIIMLNGRRIGQRTTLKFFVGKPKEGKKTNWIMQEYTTEKKKAPKKTRVPDENTELDSCVLCKIYETPRKRNKNGESDDEDEQGTSSSASRSQAQENKAVPSLQNPLASPPNINSGGRSSFSNLAGQYSLHHHNVPAFNNGSVTPFGSTNYGFGLLHQEVRNVASLAPAQQRMSTPLVHSTNTNNQGAHVFNGSTTYHHPTQKGFGPQSVPMYNNGTHLDNSGHGMVPMDETEFQTYLYDEPLPDFGFSFDDTDEGVPFGMPDIEPLNSVPPMHPVMYSTQTDGKKSTTPTDDH